MVHGQGAGAPGFLGKKASLLTTAREVEQAVQASPTGKIALVVSMVGCSPCVGYKKKIEGLLSSAQPPAGADLLYLYVARTSPEEDRKLMQSLELRAAPTTFLLQKQGAGAAYASLASTPGADADVLWYMKQASSQN